MISVTKRTTPVRSQLRLPSVEKARGTSLLKLKKFPGKRKKMEFKHGDTPDTERAESMATRGGNWPDQRFVADTAGED